MTDEEFQRVYLSLRSEEAVYDEARRARASEAALLREAAQLRAALRQIVHCAHDDCGYLCETCRKVLPEGL